MSIDEDMNFNAGVSELLKEGTGEATAIHY